MAKADLRKAETVWTERVGAALRRAAAGMSLKEVATALNRDARQVGRWMEGKERTQVDVVLAADELRQAFVLALASLADDVVIETVIRARRRV